MAQISVSWLISAVFVAVISSALFLREFRINSPITAVGMDLGTSFSCSAAHNETSGKAFILRDEKGRGTTASIVAFTQEGKILTGEDARLYALEFPSRTVFDAKRFIGRKMSHIKKDLDLDLYPFQVRHSLRQTSSGLKHYRPEEISAEILKRLKGVAETNIGRSISQVVLAVPVEFTEEQMNATTRAAQLAGLEVLRLIYEPTAAAMAYGLHAKMNVQGILVFDFGGGTLDVSLLSVSRRVFNVRATYGDKRLGGEDFNHYMMNYFLENIRKAWGEETVSEREKDRKFIQAVRAEVERTKIALSTVESITFEVHDGGKSYREELNRTHFDHLNRHLFERAMIPVEKVLQCAEATIDEVDEIVLIGGSSRLLRVRELLREKFGDKLNTEVNPDQAVAMGTAVQAGILTDARNIPVAAVEQPYRAPECSNE
ncbi:heat shock 70 kD protein cognate [Planoprotostelium fungivorum]|uniref:Heat shock 70 kD protein cognate n=1 Tax=Planoprotostelium fungivorum TaxID=1890364 RepID=A0A2P6NCJ7_9EUKA|nr:heat shock 70 kD protein cognate [Planoprotostelium fungivorum]